MMDYGRQRSTVKPPETEVTDDKVYVAYNIVPITEPGTDGSPGFKGYEFNYVEYEKNEYIQSLVEKNNTLNQQLLNMQMMLLGG